jgi:hypothetical protein
MPAAGRLLLPGGANATIVSHNASAVKTWDRCYDFLNIFAEKCSKNVGGCCSNYKNLIITLVFEKNA